MCNYNFVSIAIFKHKCNPKCFTTHGQTLKHKQSDIKTCVEPIYKKKINTQMGLQKYIQLTAKQFFRYFFNVSNIKM